MPSVTRNRGQFVYNGLDRLDTSQGYAPGNVVPCCGDCNWAKRARTRPEFLAWVVRVYWHSVPNAI